MRAELVLDIFDSYKTETNYKKMTNDEAKEILSRPFDMENILQDILDAHRMGVDALDKLDKIEHIVKEYQDDKLFKGDAVFEICVVLKNKN